MRGVKIFGDQKAKPGSIIVRQLGTKWHAGENVGMGRDHTLFALVEGGGESGTEHALYRLLTLSNSLAALELAIPLLFAWAPPRTAARRRPRPRATRTPCTGSTTRTRGAMPAATACRPSKTPT
mgnify:CR=1 FL=1